MGTENQTTAKELSKADAAKRVRRPVTRPVTDKEGNVKKDEQGNVVTKTEHVPVAADEVLSFKDHGTHVVVVTKDGQKFSDAE
jgi:DNA-binding LytR/AlgR family response regulator